MMNRKTSHYAQHIKLDGGWAQEADTYTGLSSYYPRAALDNLDIIFNVNIDTHLYTIEVCYFN